MSRASPPMPFWADDWLTSETILMMDPAEEGALIHLCALCWRDPQCSLPSDPRELARLSRLPLRRWTDRLRSCFSQHPVDSNRLTHPKVFQLFRDRLDFRAKCSKAGQRGNDTRWGSDRVPDADPIAKPSLPTPTPIPKEEESEKPVVTRSRAPSPSLPGDDWPGWKVISEWMPQVAGLQKPEAQKRARPVWVAALQRLEKDHTWSDISRLVAWVRGDEFWARNCCSPAKLLKLDKDKRRYWDRLWSEMEKPRKAPEPDLGAAAVERTKRKLEEMEIAKQRAVAPPAELLRFIGRAAKEA